jgi:hypothetical protein
MSTFNLRPAHHFPALAQLVGVGDSDVELPRPFDNPTFPFFAHPRINTRIERAVRGMNQGSAKNFFVSSRNVSNAS